MVTVSLPSLVPPKGTGEAPALSPPSGASPPALYKQQAAPTLRPKEVEKRKPLSGRCDRGII